MIGSSEAFDGKDLAREGAKPSLHPVAHHRAADLLGDGKADAHGWVRILAVADEQDETGSGRAPAAVRGKKIGALCERD
jgi:hypothetical protein